MSDRVKAVVPLAAALVVAATLRLFRLSHQSLWCDELFSYNLSRESLGVIWSRAVEDAVHPPLYYFVLHPFAARTADETWLRFPSVVFGVLSVWLTYRLALELTNRATALVAAWLMVLSTFQLYHSQETRMYTMLTCFGLVALWALWRALTASQARYWVTFVVASTLALYTNYLAAAIAVTAFSTLATHFRAYRRALQPFLLSAALTALLWTPWALAMMEGGEGIHSRRRLGSVQIAALATPVALMDFSLGYWNGLSQFYHERPPVDNVQLGILLCGLVAATGLAAAGLAAGPRNGLAHWYLVHCLTGPIAIGFLVATQTHFKETRYFALASPALVLVLALGLVRLFERRSMLRWPLTVGLSAAVLTSVVNYNLNWRYWRDDWRSVARFMNNHYQPGDALIFNAGWMDLPFNHYVQLSGRQPYPTERVPQDNHPTVEEVETPLTKHIAGHRRLWLVLCYSGASDPKGLVQGSLDRRTAFKNQWQYSGVTLRLYECESKA